MPMFILKNLKLDPSYVYMSFISKHTKIKSKKKLILPAWRNQNCIYIIEGEYSSGRFINYNKRESCVKFNLVIKYMYI